MKATESRSAPRSGEWAATAVASTRVDSGAPRGMDCARCVPQARRASPTCALLLLAACAVGPDYVRPTSAEAPPGFKEVEGWKPAQPKDDTIRGAWWEMFEDPELSALEQRIDASNQTLAAAEAQFREARALVGVARAAYFPKATVGVGVTRSLASSTLSPGTFTAVGENTAYSMPLDISWTLDVFGQVRRSVEANRASAQASAAAAAFSRLTLETELAVDYFQLRTLDAQAQLLRDTATGYQKSLELTENRYNAGVAARTDVATAETQLKTTQAQAIDVEVQRAQLEHAIAVLIGEPASVFTLAASPLNLSTTPPAVPIGLPSELLERRADIAQAERSVASANADIGVAIAAYYPTVTLTAAGGLETATPSKWFNIASSRFWSVGPTITETVFDGGLRSSQTEQARATYDATVASYRGAVLTGFQQVEDNLAALRILESEAGVLADAVRAAETSTTLTLNQYKAGTVNYIDVVTVQAIELSNRITAVNVLGRRMTSCVQLINALGGGWETTDLPAL
ncbi:MAG TPA: efflux transporter outer membrane subunit [Myxococcota bacterium]|nr:efflux transporter outer membrane subunit [Myxococcota bacterium]